MKIFVVDDEPDICTMLEVFLHSAGHEEIRVPQWSRRELVISRHDDPKLAGWA